jgi:hypothetical protein
MPEPPGPATPDRLAVTPSLVAETGRRLRAMTDALAAVAPNYRGPQATPALGEPVCSTAYATAHHQLAGLVTQAVGAGRALAGSVATAATLYAVLDGGSGL